ncbi:hypothetical protein R3W88_034145 [Solanum pinnatisectum]|uniref:Uncharacterized protein n=1 Tax=Solanum pinnatisectum TaxID=50273 RepID=A0AAV9JZG7_9SOLN|nr:hypothetical protein R3W88_034145 [Solanum pinnatisectum]
MCEEENILISQLEELKVEGQLLDHTFIDVVIVEKSTLEDEQKFKCGMLM